MPKHLILVFLIATSCSHKSQISKNGEKVERLLIQELAPLHKDRSGTVSLGGLSDLVFSPRESTQEVKVFYAVTDRGPNKKTIGPKTRPQRPFLFPEFTPQIIKIEFLAKTRQARVSEQRPLKNPNGTAVRGLPNVAALRDGAAVEEQPVNSEGQVLELDPWGLDPEGLALDDQGHFWLAEEYGPSVAKVSSDGRVLKRWYPQDTELLRGGQTGLPAFLSHRNLNRGFEAAVWLPAGKLLLFLQSELPASKHHKWSPVIEFDTRKEVTTAVYFYPLSAEGGKIGGASTDPSGKIFLLEQNGETGSQAWQKVFELQMQEATDVLAETREAGLAYKITEQTVPIQKKEAIDLTELGLQDFEKLEGLSLLSEREMYILNDNDFDVEGNADESSKSYLFQFKRN